MPFAALRIFNKGTLRIDLPYLEWRIGSLLGALNGHLIRPVEKTEFEFPAFWLTAERSTVELPGDIGDKKRDNWGCRKAVNRR
jgi:hypothetical protein